MWNDLVLIDPRKEDGDAKRAQRVRVPDSEVPWRLNVLVIDDDQLDTWLIENALRGDLRIRRIIVTHYPELALAQLRQGKLRPNLILLDVNMPKINGFGFLDALVDIPAMTHVPIVMLTTSRHENDVKLARGKKVKGYVIKPDRFEDLRSRLTGVVTQVLQGRR